MSIQDSLRELESLAARKATLCTAWVADTGEVVPLLRVTLDDSQAEVTVTPTLAGKTMLPGLLRESVVNEPFLLEEITPLALGTFLGIKAQPGETLLEVFERGREQRTSAKFAVGSSMREIRRQLEDPEQVVVLNPEGGPIEQAKLDEAAETGAVPMLRRGEQLHQVILKTAPVGVPETALAIEHSVQEALSEHGVPTARTKFARDTEGKGYLVVERFDRNPIPVAEPITRRHLLAGPAALTLNEVLRTEGDEPAVASSPSAAAAYLMARVPEKQKAGLAAALYTARRLGNIDLHGENFSVLFHRHETGVRPRLAPLYDMGAYGMMQAPADSLRRAHLLEKIPLRISQSEAEQGIPALGDFALNHTTSATWAFEQSAEILKESAGKLAELQEQGLVGENDVKEYQGCLLQPLLGAERLEFSLRHAQRAQESATEMFQQRGPWMSALAQRQ